MSYLRRLEHKVCWFLEGKRVWKAKMTEPLKVRIIEKNDTHNTKHNEGRQ